jgi:ATP-binding cassette subfamily F protein 2
MSSIDALARAIKEYEGGVVIVSHDFRMFRLPSLDLSHTQRNSPGLISQVANELWEVKNRKIRNLTKEDISIVDYKRMLIKNSAFSSLCSPIG